MLSGVSLSSRLVTMQMARSTEILCPENRQKWHFWHFLTDFETWTATYEAHSKQPLLSLSVKNWVIVLHSHGYQPQKFGPNTNHHNNVLIVAHYVCACCLLLVALHLKGVIASKGFQQLSDSDPGDNQPTRLTACRPCPPSASMNTLSWWGEARDRDRERGREERERVCVCVCDLYF